MKVFIEVILPLMCFFAGAIGLLCVLVRFICWVTTVPAAPKIKYKSFKTFYNLNPDRWELDDGYVWCRLAGHHKGFSKEIFRFTFIGYLRYCFWMWSEEKHEEKMDHAEATAKMLASVKHDIETMEQRAQKYQTQAIDDLQQILNNIK